jgi:hypothetical protein
MGSGTMNSLTTVDSDVVAYERRDIAAKVMQLDSKRGQID